MLPAKVDGFWSNYWFKGKGGVIGVCGVCMGWLLADSLSLPIKLFRDDWVFISLESPSEASCLIGLRSTWQPGAAIGIASRGFGDGWRWGVTASVLPAAESAGGGIRFGWNASLWTSTSAYRLDLLLLSRFVSISNGLITPSSPTIFAAASGAVSVMSANCATALRLRACYSILAKSSGLLIFESSFTCNLAISLNLSLDRGLVATFYWEFPDLLPELFCERYLITNLSRLCSLALLNCAPGSAEDPSLPMA